MSNPGLGITRIRYNGCNLSQLWSSLNTALVSWRTSSAPLNGANIVKILIYTYLFTKKSRQRLFVIGIKFTEVPHYSASPIRWRTTSKSIIAAAADTFNDSVWPINGIANCSSHIFKTSLEIPLSSAPITITVGLRRSAS